MWNPSEIFSNNADKANLLTAILSVIAAVLVVLVTHVLAQRRSRNELHAKKMEELYAAVTDFANAGWTYMHKRAGSEDQTLEIMSAYSAAHSKVEMLASIYADEISSDIAAMDRLVILTKDGSNADLSLFPEKLQAFVKSQSAIQQRIASKVRKFI